MVSSSPGLIAASHVLRRLSKPRHSPYALLTCRKDARARYGVLKEFIAPRNPPAYEFECDSRFPRSSCDVKDRSFRAARGAQRSASVRRPGHDWRTEVRVHVAVMLVGMLGVAVPPGGGRCAKS